MRKPYTFAAMLALATMGQSFPAPATESVPEARVVVKRSSFEGPWPFSPGQAQLTCRPRGYAMTVALPDGQYALNAAARAEGVAELASSKSVRRDQADRDARVEKFAQAAEALCSEYRWSQP